jgi:hypothetical protein
MNVLTHKTKQQQELHSDVYTNLQISIATAL